MSNLEYYAQTMFEALDLRTVAERYGMEFNRGGFAHCPFHSERTASFKIEPNGKYGHCFGCGHNATVINLTMALLGLDYLGALERLNNDFAFGFDIGAKPNLQQQRAAQTIRNEALKRKEEQRANVERYEKLIALWCYYDNCIRKFKPIDPGHDYDPRYIEAIQNIEYVSNELDGFDMREVRNN